MFIPHNCFKCNAELSVGDATVQCFSGCYLFSFISEDYIIERFKVAEYFIYNIFDNESHSAEIYPAMEETDNPYSLAEFHDTYISPYNINENKIKTYIIFS